MSVQRGEELLLHEAHCYIVAVNALSYSSWPKCDMLLMQRGEDLVLREANYCVIDEVDSILIDEARTPLIISGSAEKPSEK